MLRWQANAMFALGRFDETHRALTESRLLAEARKVIQQVADPLSAAGLRESFLGQPPVQALMRQ